MKKFIALAIAIIMMAALAVPAFAAEIDEETVNKTAQSTVSYKTGESYTVTIPETITVGNATGSDFSIDANREAGKTITVTVVSTNGFKLNANEDYAYTLSVKIGENAPTVITAQDNTVASTTAKQTVSAKLIAAWADGCTAPEAAGTYSDTLTFTVALN